MDRTLREGPHDPDRIEAQRRMARQRNAHIPGWGSDLDRARRPAVPMERTPPRLENAPSGPPEQQPQYMPILRSTERPRITPVFGTSAPPSGLSGKLRRFAYRFSENDLRHWMVLLFADRINMVEGVIGDLAQGHVPNVYREMGGRAELRHNRAGLARKAIVVIGFTAFALALWNMRRERR